MLHKSRGTAAPPPTCPAPHSPGTRRTPAPTRSQSRPFPSTICKLCALSSRKPSGTNKPQINNRPWSSPSPSTPSPGRRAQVTPPDRVTLRAHQSRQGVSERRRPQTCRAPTPGSSSPGRTRSYLPAPAGLLASSVLAAARTRCARAGRLAAPGRR